MCYNRSTNSGPCGRPGELFGLGAQHYPQLVARMREIGAIIRGNNPAPKPPPEYEPTAKCECVAATKYVCVEATKKCELSQRGLETKLECGETCGKPKPKPPAPAPVAAKYVCSKAAKKCVESPEGKLSRAVCEKECDAPAPAHEGFVCQKQTKQCERSAKSNMTEGAPSLRGLVQLNSRRVCHALHPISLLTRPPRVRAAHCEEECKAPPKPGAKYTCLEARPAPCTFSSFRTRITTCDADRVETGPDFVPILPHVVARSRRPQRSAR